MPQKSSASKRAPYPADDRQQRIEALERLRDDGRPRGRLELSCINRQLDDLRNGESRGLVWDGAEAERTVKFFSLLTHWKGKFARKPIILEPWQEECWIRPLFGWKLQDGTRRFRTGYVSLPRKQGKSTIAAGIGLKGLTADKEEGAEVYSAATKRDQSRILFTDAKKLLRYSRVLKRYVEVLQHSIICPALNATFIPLSAEGNKLDGLNVHMALIDELHAHRSREVFDVITTATGAREQPLVLSITTAGHDRASVCWEQQQYAEAVLNGHPDDAFFTFIAAADPEDDPFDPRTWWKANPNLGVSISEKYLKGEASKAKASPSYENTFRRLHLNQWVSQLTRWLQMHIWDRCKAIVIPTLARKKCWGGLDLASTRDVNSMVLVFKEDQRFWLKPYFWVPEDSHSERANTDRRHVKYWAEQGLIKTTPGSVTEYADIVRDIIAASKEFDIQELAYDPWGPAPMFVQALQAQGFPLRKLKEFRQTIGAFAVPTREFDRLLASGGIAHDGNPVLRWMAENVTVREDSSGNLRPDKEASGDKIDGIVAAIMAIALATSAKTDRPGVGAAGVQSRYAKPY